jgi:hypothetical protein
VEHGWRHWRSPGSGAGGPWATVVGGAWRQRAVAVERAWAASDRGCVVVRGAQASRHQGAAHPPVALPPAAHPPATRCHSARRSRWRHGTAVGEHWSRVMGARQQHLGGPVSSSSSSSSPCCSASGGSTGGGRKMRRVGG